MTAPGPFELASQTLGPLPVVNHFLRRIGLAGYLARHLPRDDLRLRLDPAVVIGLVVRNIVVAHRPVYALGEWAAGYEPALPGLGAGQLDALNDDRAGRTLDRLFDADRATLVTETVLRVIREFGVDVSQLWTSPSCTTTPRPSP